MSLFFRSSQTYPRNLDSERDPREDLYQNTMHPQIHMSSYQNHGMRDCRVSVNFPCVCMYFNLLNRKRGEGQNEQSCVGTYLCVNHA